MLLALTAALHPPVRSILERTVKSYRRKNKRVPELRLAPGPNLEGVTGNGSYFDLFGAVWALALTRDGLKLARLGVAGWYEVTPLEPLPLLHSSARHIGLAFDQSARPVITWEVSSQIYIRQYDGGTGQYVVRGPFAGVDPVLVMDGTVNGDIPYSDVILAHLSVSRDELIYRVQREIYATPRAVAVAANSVLDAAFVSNYALKFIGFSVIPWMITSDLYTVRDQNSIFFTASLPTNVQYNPIVLVFDAPQNNVSTVTASLPVNVQYNPIVLVFDAPLNSVSSVTASLPVNVQYNPIVLVFDAPLNTVSSVTAALPVGIAYNHIVIERLENANNMTDVTAFLPQGVSYVTV